MNRTVSAIGALAIFAGVAFGQASFTTSGYAQDFDAALGATGTTRPAGWSHYFVTGSNTLFSATSTITNIAAALPSFTLRNQALVVFNQAGVNPPATQSSTSGTAGYGYNAALSSNSTNRMLGNAGATGVGATAIELTLTNNSGAALSTLDLAYTFTVLSQGTAQGTGTNPFLAGNESELPGYRVFVSLNGSAGPWTNISGLNYTPAAQTAVGFSTNVSATGVVLPSAWNAGSNLSIRWFKDNENLASPDPLYGIDNVSVVPTPGATALLGLGALAAGRRRR